MKRKRLFAILMCMALLCTMIIQANAGTAGWNGTGELSMKLIAHYDSGSGAGGAEIVAYAPNSQKAFIVNGSERSLDIVNLGGLSQSFTKLSYEKRLALDSLATGVSDITSVAVSPDESIVAVAIPSEPKTENGIVALVNLEGTVIKTVQVGALPDMLAFTPDGNKILVANEGEPSDDYSIDPEGSVSIIDISAGAENATVSTAIFDDSVIVDSKVRGIKSGATKAQDFEPEYITLSSDGTTAYVALQEHNAIAVLDILTGKFLNVKSLGLKDWSLQEMDASDKDEAINFAKYPVLGMYQPDGIDILTIDGKDYLITPNEGDSRDYDGFSEEARVGEVKDEISLNAENYKGFTQTELDKLVEEGLFDKTKLGRLKITTELGKNSEGKYEALYTYGARSFSIYDTKTMEQVYDSGSELERLSAYALPEYFNTTNDEDAFDNRSDDKGIEPEDIETGVIGNNTYAFIGMERMGGVAVYNVTNPQSPVFVTYFTSREFGKEAPAGDLAPEGMCFVDAAKSPTGKALLLVAHEVSGTLAVIQAEPSDTVHISILHTNDIHARVIEGSYDGMGLAKISTLVEQEKTKNPNTILLDAGDTFHGQTFATLEKGLSIATLMNGIGYNAMTPGNHDFNYGKEQLKLLDAKTSFPILAANIKNSDASDFITPYTIIERGGVKIAVFGLATPETTYKTHPDNVAGLTFKSPYDEAKNMVKLLSAKADVIIALCHLGMDASSEYTSTGLAKTVNGIDVIIDGHSHTTLTNGYLEGDTLIASAGEYSKNLGFVDIYVSKGAVSSKQAHLFTKTDATNISQNEKITVAINEIKAQQDEILSEVVGTTSVTLEGERANVRAGETNLGNLIADAMLKESNADCALTNGGGIRASIEAGNISKGQVITVLPFGNYIVTKKVKGSDILAALEHGTSVYPNQAGSFPHVAGMSFTINTGKDAGKRIQNLIIAGAPVDLNKEYILATNDFMAAGGDNYTMLKDSVLINEYSALDEALIKYIQTEKAIAPKVEGRVTVTDKLASEYVVNKGDCLSKIALKFKTTWQELQRVNNIKNPDLIFVGQKLIVPVSN